MNITAIPPIPIQVGTKIWFSGEKKPYTVRCSSLRFVICTKPYNLKNTVLYTIIDTQQFIRGTENLIFCNGFESNDDCKEALARLESGELEVSHRNRVTLEIEKMES